MFNPQSFTETTLSKTNSKSFWKMVCWKTMFFLEFDPIFNVFLLLVLGNAPSFFMKHSEDWNFDDLRNCDDKRGINTSAGFSDQNPGDLVMLLYYIRNFTTQLYTHYTQTLNDVYHIYRHLVVFYGKCRYIYTIHGKSGIGCFNKPI